MVIRGSIRGNGVQLAHYLVSGEANEKIHILEVDGRLNATEKYLHQTMQGMSLTAELTKSQKGLYHAQINPAYNEDRKMSPKDWLRATDILAHELGLSEQRRVVVLHTKKNRTHAHVVFERYDHQTGRVVDNKFSRLAQDRARKEMERVFEHQPTPHRNQHRPEIKETLTNLWSQTETGKEFIKAVHENGYMLAEGVPRHPFMVVDEHGRSFDLVRQLKGVRIKEVRQRMRNETLIPEKEAIELMRQKREGSSDSNNVGQQIDIDREKAVRTASTFWDNKQETTLERAEAQSRKRLKDLADNFIESGQSLTKEDEKSNDLEKKKTRVEEYFLNGDELTHKADDIVADENTVSFIDNYIEEKQNVTVEPQENASQQRQQRVAEQFAVNRDEASQPDKVEQYRRTLRDFISEEEGMFDNNDPAIEKPHQRRQTTAREFFENEEITTAEPATDEKEIQKLIQEQKEIRERNRQKTKRRSH